MAPIKLILIALASAIASASAAEDGCTYVTDCAGSVDVALGSSCTSSYGAKGKISAPTLGAEVCLQCPGTGTIDLSTYPYFVCDGKAICGHVEIKALAKKVDIKPNQAKCIWEKPSDLLTCLSSCTPNAPGPAPGPAPSDAPAPSGAPAPSDAPAPLPGSPKPDVPKENNGCGAGQLPVSVEGGQTGCAAVPICVGGFPSGNCPEGSYCGIVKTGVPGCKLGANPSSAPSSSPSSAPSDSPSGAPSDAPSGAPSGAPTGTPSSGPSSAPPSGPKCNPNEATPAGQCGGKIVVADAGITGCAAEFKVGSKVGCIQCGEGFKVDENDPNTCYATCAGKPLCGQVSALGMNLNLTPKQMLCMVKNPNNPLGCLS